MTDRNPDVLFRRHKPKSDDGQPQPNIDLLRTTLQYIEDHPEEWDQSQWICGTRACFAGRAALLCGAKPDFYENDADDADDAELMPAELMADYCKVGNNLWDISDYAQKQLGLNDDEANDLFQGSNDMDDLKRIVREIEKSVS